MAWRRWLQRGEGLHFRPSVPCQVLAAGIANCTDSDATAGRPSDTFLNGCGSKSNSGGSAGFGCYFFMYQGAIAGTIAIAGTVAIAGIQLFEPQPNVCREAVPLKAFACRPSPSALLVRGILRAGVKVQLVAKATVFAGAESRIPQALDATHLGMGQN